MQRQPPCTSQLAPEKPQAQWHSPVAPSHVPCPEQMLNGAPRHVVAQPSPAYPVSHVHDESDPHTPCPEQNAATGCSYGFTAPPAASTAPGQAWHCAGLLPSAVNCHHVGADTTPHRSAPCTPLWHVPVSYDHPHPGSAKHGVQEEWVAQDGQHPDSSSGDAQVVDPSTMHVEVPGHHPHRSSAAHDAHVVRRAQ